MSLVGLICGFLVPNGSQRGALLFAFIALMALLGVACPLLLMDLRLLVVFLVCLYKHMCICGKRRIFA